MHRNLFWQALLVVMLAIVFWYSGLALTRYYFYSILTDQTEAINTQWKVKAKSDDQFLLEGHYQFQVKGKTFDGETLFKNEIYRNRWAAEQDLPTYSQKKWSVWYSSSYPQYSTLNRNFPLKEILSAGFLWCLLLYFLWLGYYVSRFKQNG